MGGGLSADSNRTFRHRSRGHRILGGRVQSRSAAATPGDVRAPQSAAPTERVVGPLSEADAAALATMNDRLKGYMALHQEIEAGLPKAPTAPRRKRSTRTSGRSNKRSARHGRPRNGGTSSRRTRTVILRLLATIFAGPKARS